MGIEMMRMTVENSISIAQSLLPAESSAVALSPTIEPLRVQHIQAKMEHLAGQLFAFEVPVRWDVDPEAAGAVVHTDESVLTHCMLNLFSNACKHTSQGAITVKISLAAAENAEGLGSYVVAQTQLRVRCCSVWSKGRQCCLAAFLSGCLFASNDSISVCFRRAPAASRGCRHWARAT